MKQKILLLTILLFGTITGFSKVWTIGNSGTSFSPSNITINPGDSVRFVLSSSHDAVEVSQATYNSNGNTPLSGGFQVGFGGGLVLPAKLGLGTHYFVCTPHASFGMKGTIVVSSCTSPGTPGAITGNTAVCPGNIVTYSIPAVSGATSYSWSLPSGWSGSSSTTSITAIAGSSGGAISVRAVNNCGTSSPSTISVNSGSPVTPGAITGNKTICAGSVNTYSVNPVAGAASYTWTLPNGWTGSSASNSINVTSNNQGGTISVTANNNCGSSSPQSVIVAIATPPSVPGVISGNGSVCPGSQDTWSVAQVQGATFYTWTLPSGWTGTSTTNSITATAGTVGGNITVLAGNACGQSNVQTLAVAIGTPPATPGQITGNSNVCTGSQNTYSVAQVSGATSYTWTLPDGWTGTSTTNTIAATSGNISGNITVKANNACGSSGSQSLSVIVSSVPSAPGAINGITSLCSGSQSSYSVLHVPGSSSYTWTLPNGWIGGSITNSINVIAGNSPGTISVKANNSCGSSEPVSVSLSVNSAPSKPAIISGNSKPCKNSLSTYSVAPVQGATSYSWTLPNGWSGTSNTNSINVKTGTSGGTILVTAQNGCGVSDAQNLQTEINTINTTVTQVTGATLRSNVEGTGITYQWINCATKTPVQGQTGQNITVASSGNYAVVVSSGGCADTSVCIPATAVGFTQNIHDTMLWNLYPNPSVGKVKVEAGESILNSDAILTIYSSKGTIVYHSKISGKITEINLEGKPDGIYFIKITDGNVFKSGSFILRK